MAKQRLQTMRTKDRLVSIEQEEAELKTKVRRLETYLGNAAPSGLRDLQVTQSWRTGWRISTHSDSACHLKKLGYFHVLPACRSEHGNTRKCWKSYSFWPSFRRRTSRPRTSSSPCCRKWWGSCWKSSMFSIFYVVLFLLFFFKILRSSFFRVMTQIYDSTLMSSSLCSS